MAHASALSWPNRVTVARILLVAPFVACLLNLGPGSANYLRHLAVGVFLVMAVSDFVDGFLARRLGAVSQLGRILDPIGDKLLITAAVVILAVNGVPRGSGSRELLRLPNWVAVSAIAKDLCVMIGFVVIYLLTGRVLIEVHRLGKWCTTVQLVMVLSVLLWPDLPPAMEKLPVVLWWLATVLAVAAALYYVRVGYRFLGAVPGGTKESA